MLHDVGQNIFGHSTRSVQSEEHVFWEVESSAEKVGSRVRWCSEEDSRIEVDELLTSFDDRHGLACFCMHPCVSFARSPREITEIAPVPGGPNTT